MTIGNKSKVVTSLVTHLVHDRHLHHFLSLGDPVNVMVEEAAVGVEVDVLELPLPDDLVRDLSLQVHEHLQHVIVGLTSKHNFT